MRTSNIELPTSNVEQKSFGRIFFTSMFDVGRSMFDVRFTFKRVAGAVIS